MWKKPQNPTKKSLTPPPQKKTKNLGGLLGEFTCKRNWLFLYAYMKKSPSSMPKQHSQGEAQLWVLNKARKGLSSTNYPRDGNGKSPTDSTKSQCQSCTGQLFLYEVFPHGKKPFLSLSGQSLLCTQAFKTTTFFRKAFSYFWKKNGW